MKNLIKYHKLHFYAILLLAIFPVFPTIYRTQITALFVFISIFVIFGNLKNKKNKKSLLLILFITPFILNLVSLTYSKNFHEGFVIIERAAPILLFPLLFYFLPFKYSKQKISIVIHFFGYSVLLLLTGIIIKLCFSGFINELKNSGEVHYLIRTRIGDTVNIHPTYLSLFISFTVLQIVVHITDKWKSLKNSIKTIYLFTLVYGIFFILLLSSKIIIISLIVISGLWVYINIKSKIKATVILASIVFSLVVLLIVFPTTRERFVYLFSAVKTSKIDKHNPDSMRKGIYKSAFRVIEKNRFAGVGLGDVQQELQQQYKSDNLKKAYRKRFNTHNQYLDFWISSGILSIIIFILSVLYPLFLSAVKKDFQYMVFLLLVTFVFLTENILVRQVGIIFYSLFNTLFAFSLTGNNNEVYINARFLSQKLTGVQRFSSEISEELCRINDEIKLIAPGKINNYIGLHERSIIKLRPFTSHLWEQLTLPLSLACKNFPLLINPGNSAPIFYKNKITVIHDISWKVMPQWFSSRYYRLYRFITPRILKTSKKILTVSKFSAIEIKKYFPEVKEINVIYNGISGKISHYEEKYENIYGKYILSVGSFEPRKNLETIIKCFSELNLESCKLIIAGSENRNVFKTENLNETKNIIFIKNPDDKLLASLYKNAYLFVYLPLYEGFGLPVLEALHYGVPAIVSDIPVFREIYENSVIFVPPKNIEVQKEKIVQVLNDEQLRNKYKVKGTEVIKKYNYHSSALKIEEIIKEILGNYNASKIPAI